MERPLLFAETPRAGRWNHRFLVPPEAACSEERLAEQAARARQRSQGGDYLAVVRQVQQHEGGREADELLVLQGIAVDRLDAATRRVLLQRLEQRLDDLQQLVEAINWEQDGKRLVVRREELSQWFDEDFAEELAAVRGPAPIDPPAGDSGEARSGRRRFLWITTAAATAAAIGLWRPWAAGEAPDDVPADAPELGERLAPASLEAAELRELEAPLRRLAQRWRLPERADPFPKLCEAVVEKLERDLATSTATGLAPEQRLAALVDSLAHQLLRSAPAAGTVRSHLEDEGFQDRLLSIYSAEGLDFAAPLRVLTAPDDYDGQQQLRALRALCPARSKQQVAAFRRLVGEARELTLAGAGAEPLDADTELVRRLHGAGLSAATLRWPVESGAGEATAVLSRQDAAAAAVLVQWIGRSGIAPAPGASEAAAVASLRGFIDAKRDFLEALSQQTPPGRRALAIRCARLLLRFDRTAAADQPPELVHRHLDVRRATSRRAQS